MSFCKFDFSITGLSFFSTRDFQLFPLCQSPLPCVLFISRTIFSRSGLLLLVYFFTFQSYSYEETVSFQPFSSEKFQFVPRYTSII